MQRNDPNATICIEKKTNTDKGEGERARVMDCITHLPSAVWATQLRVPDYSQPVVTSAVCVIVTPADKHTHTHTRLLTATHSSL